MSWRWWKLPIVVVVALAVWFVVHAAITVSDGLRDDLASTDVGVVLGNKVELDGQPSDRLRARLDRAVELFDDGLVGTIVVSGGVGAEGFDEAVVMRDHLVEHGVPPDRVIVDSDGSTTWMTARNAAAMAEEFGFESVTVITQYHHISRSKLAFRKAGFEEVHSAHARIVEWRDVYSIGREFVAYYRYALR